MLQITNADDGKSEWNINETHIIIPMIDGDVTNKDKILTSTLTLNSLESGDQTILTNALEHSLVIGLDKNLFETPNYKSDLVIIQNSDLKLLSCNSDLKNPVAYTLSYVDQDKSEILWQTSIPKDRICASDKAILEVRDVLNYDDSVNELEKSEQQVNLDCLESEIASQVAKTGGGEILTGSEHKKESQFINYYSSSQNSEAEPVLSHLDAAKFIENVEGVELKKQFENETQSAPDFDSSTYQIGKNTGKNILSITDPVVGINESVPVKFVEYVKYKTDCETVSNRIEDTKDEKTEEKLRAEGVSNFLPEKSLPLKKKAKMKRTLGLFNSENRMSLLKQDLVATNRKFKSPAERKTKKPLITANVQEDSCTSSFEAPFIQQGTKRKKPTNFKSSSKKLQKLAPNKSAQEDENDSKKLANNLVGEDSSIKINCCTFDKNKFNNIYDLVESLRKCQIISATVWQMLNSGLKEMKVDILKEMNAKINENYSPERTHYSPQLKAFALIMYFKQPAAFNHLSQVYKTGWPSLSVIKVFGLLKQNPINEVINNCFLQLEENETKKST